MKHFQNFIPEDQHLAIMKFGIGSDLAIFFRQDQKFPHKIIDGIQKAFA